MSIKWKIAQKAERKWWQRYLRNKDVDVYLTWKKQYWQDILNIAEPYMTPFDGREVLDAGCGPAGIFMALTKAKVVAFDPLIDSYELDLPHFNKKKYPHVQFLKAGVEGFKVDGQFDIIFCMNAINHVYDIKKGYSNLVNHLKPNGYLVLTIDAHNFNLFKTIFRALPGDILHPCQYNLAEYESFLTNNNCKIVHTQKLKQEFFFDHYLQIAQKQHL